MSSTQRPHHAKDTGMPTLLTACARTLLISFAALASLAAADVVVDEDGPTDNQATGVVVTVSVVDANPSDTVTISIADGGGAWAGVTDQLMTSEGGGDYSYAIPGAVPVGVFAITIVAEDLAMNQTVHTGDRLFVNALPESVDLPAVLAERVMEENDPAASVQLGVTDTTVPGVTETHTYAFDATSGDNDNDLFALDSDGLLTPLGDNTGFDEPVFNASGSFNFEKLAALSPARDRLPGPGNPGIQLQVEVAVSDGRGSAANLLQYVTVADVNDPPRRITLNLDGLGDLTEDAVAEEVAAINIAFQSDEDGDDLTWSVIGIDPAGAGTLQFGADGGADLAATFVGEVANSGSTADGVAHLYFTPATDFYGPVSLDIQVDDGTGEDNSSFLQELDLVVAPVADAPRVTVDGAPLASQVVAGAVAEDAGEQVLDLDAIVGLSEVDSDQVVLRVKDGGIGALGTLAIQGAGAGPVAVLGDGAPVNLVVRAGDVLGGGAAGDVAAQVLTFTPDVDVNGTADFALEIYDSSDGSTPDDAGAIQEITVRVTVEPRNDDPVIFADQRPQITQTAPGVYQASVGTWEDDKDFVAPNTTNPGSLTSAFTYVYQWQVMDTGAAVNDAAVTSPEACVAAGWTDIAGANGAFLEPAVDDPGFDDGHRWYRVTVTAIDNGIGARDDEPGDHDGEACASSANVVSPHAQPHPAPGGDAFDVANRAPILGADALDGAVATEAVLEDAAAQPVSLVFPAGEIPGATDADGDSLRWVLTSTTTAAGGTVGLLEGGSDASEAWVDDPADFADLVAYSPPTDFNGEDSFSLFLVDIDEDDPAAEWSQRQEVVVSIPVTAVNDAPDFAFNEVGPYAALVDDDMVVTLDEDAGAGDPIVIAGFVGGLLADADLDDTTGVAEDADFSFDLVVAPGDAGLFDSPPAITYDEADGGSWDLSFTLAADANAAAGITIAVTLDDDGARDDNAGNDGAGDDPDVTKSFTLVVQPANDAPTVVLSAADEAVSEDDGAYVVTVAEDAGAVAIAGFAGMDAGPDDEDAAQSVRAFAATTTSGSALFAVAPAVSTAGELSFTLAADAYGTAVVELTVEDQDLVADADPDAEPDTFAEAVSEVVSFTIQVDQVNDAPGFSLLSASYSVDEDGGPFRIDGAVFDLLADGTDDWAPAGTSDAGQGFVGFAVTTDADDAFAVLPAIEWDGAEWDLTFELAEDVNTAYGDPADPITLTVVLTDDNGTPDDEGDDLPSASQTIDLTIDPTNDDLIVLQDGSFLATLSIDGQVDEDDAAIVDLSVAGVELTDPDRDREGDTYTWTITQATDPGGLGGLVFTASGDADPVDRVDGDLPALSFVPDNGDEHDNGTAMFELTVADQGGHDQVIAVEVVVAPVDDHAQFTVIDSLAATAVPEDVVTSLAFPGLGTVDVLGRGVEGILFSIDDPDFTREGDSATVSVPLATANGAVSIIGGTTVGVPGSETSELTITAASNHNQIRFWYAPNKHYFGEDGFTVTIADDGAVGPGDPVDEITVALSVDPVNDAPTITSIRWSVGGGPATTYVSLVDGVPTTVPENQPVVEEGAELTLEVTVADVEADGTAFDPSDPLSQVLTFTPNQPAAPTYGSIGYAGAPAGPPWTFTITYCADCGPGDLVGAGGQVTDSVAGVFADLHQGAAIPGQADGATAQLDVPVTVTPVNDAPIIVVDPAAIPVVVDQLDPAAPGFVALGALPTDEGAPYRRFALPDGGRVELALDDATGYSDGWLAVTAVAVQADVDEDATVGGDPDAILALPVGAIDVDGDALTWTLAGAPVRGTASFEGFDGSQATSTPGNGFSLVGAVAFTPAADDNGTDGFTLTVADASVTSSLQVQLAIAPVNDAPGFALRSDDTGISLPANGAYAVVDEAATLSIREDTGAVTISGFIAPASLVGDADDQLDGGGSEATQTFASADGAAFAVTVGEVSTGDPLFATAPTIDVDSGDLSFALNPDANGTVTLSIVLTDDGDSEAVGGDHSAEALESAPIELVLVVVPGNDVPGFALAESLGDLPVDVAYAIVDDTPTFTLPEDANGNLEISFSGVAGSLVGDVNDQLPGGGSESGQTFLTEDGAAFAITLGAGSADLFAIGGEPALALDGTLTFTLAEDANGVAFLDVVLTDDGDSEAVDAADVDGAASSAPQRIEVVVTPVNDPPAFALADAPTLPPGATFDADGAGPTLTLEEDAGDVAISGFVAELYGHLDSEGVDVEPDQVFSAVDADDDDAFQVVVVSGSHLFDEVPAIGLDGELTFGLAANANGTAELDISLIDDGDSEDRGVDDVNGPQQSAVLRVDLVVTPTNDAPKGLVLTGGAYLPDPDGSVVALVPENVGQNQVIGVLQGLDWDIEDPPSASPASSDSFAYNIVTATGAAFSINHATGELIFGVDPDFEGLDEYQVQVRVTDEAHVEGVTDSSFTQLFVITIADTNEPATASIVPLAAFDDGLGGLAVPENTPAGTKLATLVIDDDDPDGTYDVALTAPGAGNDNGVFRIDQHFLGDTPVYELFVADGAPFPSFEDGDALTVRLSITDYDPGADTTEVWGPQDLAVAVVDVNEPVTGLALNDDEGNNEDPVEDDPTDAHLAGPDADVDENAAAGTVVAQVVIAETDDEVAHLGYQLTVLDDADTAGVDESTWFEAVESDGAWSIRVKAGAVIDFEALASVDLPIQVDDFGPEAAQDISALGPFEVTVAVRDVNEALADLALDDDESNDALPADPTDAHLDSGVDANVDENSAADTQIAVLVLTEADDEDAHDGYAISVLDNTAPGAPAGIDESSWFKVVDASGTGAGPFSLQANADAAINFEDLPAPGRIVVPIQVQDLGEGAPLALASTDLTVDFTVTIQVVDLGETPDDITLSNSDILENTGTHAEIGVLDLPESDASDTLSFEVIQPGGGETVPFTAINDAGTWKLVTSGNLNYEDATNPLDGEGRPVFTVNIGVRDDVGDLVPDATEEFQIVLLDENEGLAAIVIDVNEGEPAVGTDVVEADAIARLYDDDGDAGTSVTALGAGEVHASFDEADYTASPLVLGQLLVTEQEDLVGGHTFALSWTDDGPGVTAAVGDYFSISEGGELSAVGFIDNEGALRDQGLLDPTASPDDDQTLRLTVTVGDPLVGDQEGADGSYDVVVLIGVNDVNEAPTVALDNLAIDELDGGDIFIGNLSVDDPEGDAVVAFTAGVGFQIVDGDQLWTVGGIDHDTVPATDVLTALVSVDMDVGPDVADESFDITVANLNDETPQFVLGDGSFEVDENSPGGTFIADLDLTDADGLAAPSFVAGALTPAIFTITSAGVISVNTADLDFEALPPGNPYTVTVHATDGANPTSTTVQIEVIDLNDEAPSLAALVGPFSVNEDGTGASLPDADASDGDVDNGVNGSGDALSYSLTGGDGNFVIGESDGVVALSPSASFDFETTESYTVTITVTDEADRTDFVEVDIAVVDLNDETPILDAIVGGPFSVDEDGTVNALPDLSAGDGDVDNGTNATGDALTFSLGGGDGNFEIDGATGEVSLAAGASFDFEVTQSYTLTVTVTDEADRTDFVEVDVEVIDLNDEAPNLAALAGPYSVDEDGTVNALPDADATDADVDNGVNATGDELTYSLTGDVHNFEIDAATGALSLADGASFDFETTQSYDLRITVTDENAHSDFADVTIAVVDLNDEVPVLAALVGGPFSVDEDGGDPVLPTLSATDADIENGVNATGDALSYSLTGGDGNFEIGAITGVVSLAGGASFDHEVTTGYTLRVTVTDGVGHTDFVDVDVAVNDLNDSVPVVTLNPGGYQVNENLTAGVVGTFAVTDADTLTNDDVTVTTASSDFAVAYNPATDTATISVVATADLDFEAGPNPMNLTVTVGDGAASFDQDIQIAIADVNEVPIILAQTFTVDETDTTWTRLVQTSDTDDGGGNDADGAGADTLFDNAAAFAFRVPDADGTIDADGSSQFDWVLDDGTFRIAATGEITLKPGQTLDLDDGGQSTYALNVRVTDAAGASAEAVITIEVTAVNESPTWLAAAYAGSVDENVAGPATQVIDGAIQLRANDPEGLPQDITITSILDQDGGDAAGAFTIVADALNRVTVTRVATFDHEASDSYAITLRAADPVDGGVVPADVVLTVSVGDVNEAVGPIGLSVAGPISIDENATAAAISVASAGDLDQADGDADNDYGEVAYVFLTAGGAEAALVDGPFAIDPDDGQIDLVVAQDYEVDPTSYTLTVAAIDRAGAWLTILEGVPSGVALDTLLPGDATQDSTTLEVAIEDVDEIPPTGAFDLVVTPRTSAVRVLVARFSEVIDGLDGSDLAIELVPAGGGAAAPVALSGIEVLTQAEFVTWLGGGAVTPAGGPGDTFYIVGMEDGTTTQGTYTATIAAASSGIADPTGNDLVGDLTAEWVLASPDAIANGFIDGWATVNSGIAAAVTLADLASAAGDPTVEDIALYDYDPDTGAYAATSRLEVAVGYFMDADDLAQLLSAIDDYVAANPGLPPVSGTLTIDVQSGWNFRSLPLQGTDLGWSTMTIGVVLDDDSEMTLAEAAGLGLIEPIAWVYDPDADAYQTVGDPSTTSGADLDTVPADRPFWIQVDDASVVGLTIILPADG